LILKKLGIFFKDIKLEHSLFALPFAYLGLFMAGRRWPDLDVFVWVTVAMVSFRTMAMGLNRLFDCSIDALNPRTRDRALPGNRIMAPLVWVLILVSFMIFETSAARLGNICLWLSPVPLILAWLYPFAKRFTWLSHFILGLILGIAPSGAWIAATQQCAWAPLFLTAGVTCWVAGFDMIYALQDIDFDIQQGLFSFPARFGIASTLKLTRLLHAISFLCWGLAGTIAGMGFFYWIGLAVVAGFLFREHFLVRNFGVARVNEAFFLMNVVVSLAIFFAAVLDVTL